MMNELQINTDQYGLEPSKAKQIETIFSPMVEMLKQFESQYNEIISIEKIDESLCKKAKRLRLDISKIRVNADKAHKSAKEESLRTGKAIDGVRNILKYAIQDKEEKLKSIEKHFENLEKERISKLATERANVLIDLGFEPVNGLGEMGNEIWDNYLFGLREQLRLKKEAEEKADKERLEREKREAEERERIRLENEKLRKELEEKQKIEAERKRKEDEENRKRLEAEKKQKAEYEEKLRLEREKQFEVKRKLAEIETEKQRKIAEEKALTEKRLFSSDSEKLEMLINDLKIIQFPSVESRQAQKIIDLAANDISTIIIRIEEGL